MIVKVFLNISWGGRFGLMSIFILTVMPLWMLLLVIRRQPSFSKWRVIACLIPFVAMIHQCIFVSRYSIKTQYKALNLVASVCILIITSASLLVLLEFGTITRMLYHIPYGRTLNGHLGFYTFFAPTIPVLYAYIVEQRAIRNIWFYRSIVMIVLSINIILFLVAFSLIPLYNT